MGQIGFDLLKKSWSFRSWMALAGFLVIFLSGNFYVAHWAAHSLESQHRPLTDNPQADAIVILGGGTKPPLPPRQHPELGESGDRLIHGAFLFHQEYAPLVVTTGSYVSVFWDAGPDRSEAADMRQLLIMLGVPEDRILIEPASQNTRENAQMTAELLQKQQIDRIILVTSATHMPRAVRVFEKQGFQVIPAPADYFVTGEPDISNGSLGKNFNVINLIPQAKFVKVTTNVMKEYVGLVYYRLRGWI